jgi:hypothetical protein
MDQELDIMDINTSVNLLYVMNLILYSLDIELVDMNLLCYLIHIPMIYYY